MVCAATLALGRSETSISRDSILMQLQSWHVHSGASHSTKVECSEYMLSTGCSWTAQWSCPDQPVGMSGAASNDGTFGYKCCCEDHMWKNTAKLTYTKTHVGAYCNGHYGLTSGTSLSHMQSLCASDTNCGGVIDWWCNGDGDFTLCPVGFTTIEDSNGSCITAIVVKLPQRLVLLPLQQPLARMYLLRCPSTRE